MEVEGQDDEEVNGKENGQQKITEEDGEKDEVEVQDAPSGDKEEVPTSKSATKKRPIRRSKRSRVTTSKDWNPTKILNRNAGRKSDSENVSPGSDKGNCLF